MTHKDIILSGGRREASGNSKENRLDGAVTYLKGCR